MKLSNTTPSANDTEMSFIAALERAYIYISRYSNTDPPRFAHERLKKLEQENNRLKKILAERYLEIEFMKEITVKKW